MTKTITHLLPGYVKKGRKRKGGKERRREGKEEGREGRKEETGNV